RRIENDDLAAANRSVQPAGNFFHEQAIAYLHRGLHRTRRNETRFGDKVTNDDEQYERDDDELDRLFDEADYRIARRLLCRLGRGIRARLQRLSALLSGRPR